MNQFGVLEQFSLSEQGAKTGAMALGGRAGALQDGCCTCGEMVPMPLPDRPLEQLARTWVIWRRANRGLPPSHADSCAHSQLYAIIIINIGRLHLHGGIQASSPPHLAPPLPLLPSHSYVHPCCSPHAMPPLPTALLRTDKSLAMDAGCSHGGSQGEF